VPPPRNSGPAFSGPVASSGCPPHPSATPEFAPGIGSPPPRPPLLTLEWTVEGPASRRTRARETPKTERHQTVQSGAAHAIKAAVQAGS
jgi:hypothetical protein